MRIVCLNGSPKGERSVTVQGARFLSRRLAEHEIRVLHVGQRIRRLERDAAALDAVLGELGLADAIVWSFPVYLNLVPSQLKRFIELVFARGGEAILRGKYATAISTSVHFYDDLAHEYLHAVSEDLGLRFVPGFSAGPSYLLTPEARDDLLGFARHFLEIAAARTTLPAVHVPLPFVPAYEGRITAEPAGPWAGPAVRILADLGPGDSSLRSMIDLFRAHASGPVEIVRLQDLGMRGGCLGCMSCAASGACVYEDGFSRARASMPPREIVIWAGTIRDRYLSALWKTYLDRGFVNGHRPRVARTSVGFLVSGPLRHLPSLRRNLEAIAEVSRTEILGFASDDHPTDAETTTDIRELAREIDRRAGRSWQRPATFLGVAGHKIFRDLVYGNRAVLRADHLHYRRHGLYDFPTSGVRQRLRNAALSFVLRLPGKGKRAVLDRILARYRDAAESAP